MGHVPNQSSPREWLLAERMLIPAGWLASRQLFDSIQPWDESLLINQDGEYFTRAILASNGVILEPSRRVYYRSGLNDSTSRFQIEKISSLYRTVQSFDQTLQPLTTNDELKQLIANQYQRFIQKVYPEAHELRRKANERIAQLAPPSSACLKEIAESPFARLICFLFGWKVLIQLRRLRK